MIDTTKYLKMRAESPGRTTLQVAEDHFEIAAISFKEGRLPKSRRFLSKSLPVLSDRGGRPALDAYFLLGRLSKRLGFKIRSELEKRIRRCLASCQLSEKTERTMELESLLSKAAVRERTANRRFSELVLALTDRILTSSERREMLEEFVHIEPVRFYRDRARRMLLSLDS